MTASYPSTIKIFTPKYDGVTEILAEHVNSLQDEVTALETELLTTAPGFIDYSSSSTIVGWASYTTKEILYRMLGKMVFVNFVLHGNSDNVAATFTLPNASSAAPPASFLSLIRTRDNGTYNTGFVYINAGTNLCQAAYTTAGAAWTNSGLKMVQGQLFYLSG